MPKVLQPCGTEAAYQRHYKVSEKPCEPCRKAGNAASLARQRANPQWRKPKVRFSDPRVCPSCRVQFMAEKANQTYCSGLCRKRENNRRYQETQRGAVVWRWVLAVDFWTGEPVQVKVSGGDGSYIALCPHHRDRVFMSAHTPDIRYCSDALIWLDRAWMDAHPTTGD